MNVARFDPAKEFTPEEMAQVRARSDGMGLLCAVHAWLMMAAAMIFYAMWPNPFSFLVAVIVIGSRQLGLEILMHDGAHGVLMKTHGLNEWVSQWLCAYPVFADTIPYRHYHLKHHRSTQQADDPDLVLSAPFPITRWSFVRKMIRDLTGQTGVKLRTYQIRMAIKGGFFTKLGKPIIANALLLAVLWSLGKPHYYLMFWILPLLTWHMAVVRIRNIAEHAMVPDNDDPMRNARTTYASLWERALFAPYWVNYHVDHHLLMYVPCFNLPKLHALLLAKGKREQMEVQKNYAAVLKMATSKT